MWIDFILYYLLFFLTGGSLSKVLQPASTYFGLYRLLQVTHLLLLVECLKIVLDVMSMVSACECSSCQGNGKEKLSAEWSDVDRSLVSHPDEDQRYLSTETDWSGEFGTLIVSTGEYNTQAISKGISSIEPL